LIVSEDVLKTALKVLLDLGLLLAEAVDNLAEDLVELVNLLLVVALEVALLDQQLLECHIPLLAGVADGLDKASDVLVLHFDVLLVREALLLPYRLANETIELINLGDRIALSREVNRAFRAIGLGLVVTLLSILRDVVLGLEIRQLKRSYLLAWMVLAEGVARPLTLPLVLQRLLLVKLQRVDSRLSFKASRVMALLGTLI